ncbi:hypothetical protein ASE48_18335 [Mycobacterium sp. Root265]|uniref:hypothetical protein n=1 Tax=Mycobacterium sp. Root265 TaxID=1736504 RepID=UPI00070D2D69|nr:hypothetical protein [Mycobacterium sp. Root265]KRD05163.1 hypothetical protein ASE48_18335 [Mycobacterium sp. Root265]
MNWVARSAVALIAVQLLIRSVLAFGGDFYWDDLILVGRAGTQSLLSAQYLFDDHDGHVMPGAFLVAGAITRLAPLQWVGPAISLVVLQLLASAALLRALQVILGWRPVLLIPLTFALFTPLTVPGFAWWAAGLNSLPMLAALAWVCADAILLVRTGNRRYAVTGVLVYAGGLLFFEKSAVIPFVAFAVAALLAWVTGASVAQVWRRGLRLWIGLLAVTAAWIGVYLVVVDQQRWSLDLGMTWDLLLRSVTHGIVPGLAGGPWDWQRWAPASPWATPSATAMVLGWLVLAAVVAVSLARKERIGPVWLAAVGYAVACQVPIYLMRSSQFTALELAQTLRYLPDLVVVLALLSAVAFCAPNRASSRRLDASASRSVVVLVVAAAFVGSSLYSTMTFLRVWQDSPVPGYLDNARSGLAAVDPLGAPLLDQEVDPMIMQRVAAPENLASHMFALLPDRPEFSSATTELRVLDSTGRLRDALVTWVRTIVPGPAPHCGYLVQTEDSEVVMPLDGPLLPADWTAEINYLANSEGSLTMSLTEGVPVKVPVHPGLNRVFVRLSGAGDAVRVSANTAALSVCIASGPIGFVAPR